jgi:anti-sigma-K factor RskA
VSAETPRSCTAERADDLAAYALGALDAAQAARLQGHLDGCVSCRRRLEWLQPAVDLLPASVPQDRPSPQLRERLMATVRAEAAAESTAGDPAGSRPVGEDPAGAAPPPAHASLGERLRRRLRAPMLRPALAGLAVVAALVAGVAGYQLGSDGSGSEGREYAAMPISPDLGARGTLTVDGDSGALHVDNLPGIPRDEVYQVWVRHDRDVLPSSVFVVSREGQGEVAIPDKLEGADEVLVTREPAGGSSVATTAPLLSAQLD